MESKKPDFKDIKILIGNKALVSALEPTKAIITPGKAYNVIGYEPAEFPNYTGQPGDKNVPHLIILDDFGKRVEVSNYSIDEGGVEYFRTIPLSDTPNV